VYTVISGNSSSTPSCSNVTVPYPLQVDATVANGPLSRYGWVDQASLCTYLVLTNSGKRYLSSVLISLFYRGMVRRLIP